VNEGVCVGVRTALGRTSARGPRSSPRGRFSMRSFTSGIIGNPPGARAMRRPGA